MGDDLRDLTGLYWPDGPDRWEMFIIRDDRAAAALGHPDRNWFVPNSGSLQGGHTWQWLRRYQGDDHPLAAALVLRPGRPRHLTGGD